MFWDERYAEDGHAYGTEPNDWIRACGPKLEGPVLCLAEGEGRNAVFLAGLGLDVHAMDQSAVGVRKMRELAAQLGVPLQVEQGDLTDFDLGSERWGAIVGVFHHLPPSLRADVHARIVQALRPGGVYAFEAYTPRQLQFGTGGPPVVEMLFEPEIIRAELAGLQPEHFAEVERDIQEGKYHQGTSATLQGLLRK